MAMAPPPAHFAHILASSPFNEGKPSEPSSPGVDSPPSDAPRYFSEHDYDDRKYSYSSPPSSVPSSGGHSSSYAPSGFQTFSDYCEPQYGYTSSPVPHPSHGYHLPPPPHMHSHLPYHYMQHHEAHHNMLLPPPPQPQPQAQPQQAPRAAMIPGLMMDRPAEQQHDASDRPEPKRRKTCPEIFTTSSSPTGPKQPKRGAGKDGEDVWPTDVETAFFESIRLVPKLGRKKIVVGGKPCGRNELIGDYIRRKTGTLRSRKQVSSHIQVLKNIRRHDLEFMDLVAEPKAGEVEGDFTAEAHALFFAPQEFAHVQPENLLPPPPSVSSLTPPGQRDGLLSPYCGGSFFSQTSSSGASSPALSACSGRSPSPYLAHTPSQEDLPQQVYHLRLASSPGPEQLSGYMPQDHTMHGSIAGPSLAASAPYGGATPLPPLPQITSVNVDATPKTSPSKLGHRRAASRGLSLHIPPNTFAQQQQDKLAPQMPQMQNGALRSPMHAHLNQSNPSTPWPQVLHTPTCPPPAPALLSSPSQKNRLAAIWANTSEDWNKASPALEKSFEHELSAAVVSSRNMQKAAARTSAPLKRSYTDVPLSHATEYRVQEGLSQPEGEKEDDQFFTSLLGSREY